MIPSEMNFLVELLHNGGYTLVVEHGDEVRTFSQRGVADLMDLLEKDPEFLQGAWIADKVVGKAAAALMIKGGVVRLHTDTLSQPAFDLFDKDGSIQVECDQLVPYIENRKKDGWCPLEKLSFDKDSVEEIFLSVRDFVERMRHP